MKKIFFMAATAVLALSSCSSDEELVQAPAGAAGDIAVSFDNYLQRSGRGTHITTTESVKGNDPYQAGGFGVFAYDHAQTPVETYTNSYINPNFFNNEKITWNDPAAGRWGYSNTKYWPNNLGNMLSFYAYAPYSEKLSTEYGNSNPRLILNGDYNGPALRYKLPTNLAEGVDLCWGAEYGLPENAYLTSPVNKTKPAISEDIKFNFKHALARYGFNVQVFSDNMTDNYPDETQHDPTGAWNNGITEKTTIRINSLKLVGNFCTEGTLSLYDGKWDADIANTAEYELNNQFSDLVKLGITGDAAKGEISLFKNAGWTSIDSQTASAPQNDYVMLLPGSRFKILIDYDVETEDTKLPDNKSITNNVILSEEEFIAKPGYATDFHLNLGLTTVKFDAVVTDWNNAEKDEIDLPNNTLETVDIDNLNSYNSLPFAIGDANFLGISKIVMAPAQNKYYYNSIDQKLYVAKLKKGSSTEYEWQDPVRTVFMANSVIYYRAENVWKYSSAPRWIKVDGNNTDENGTYLLDYASKEYKLITINGSEQSPAYKTVEALAAKNPTTGLYYVGTTLYYYVQQPTGNFGQQ